MAGIGYYQGVSNVTQYVMKEVLGDEEWVEWYVKENQRRIKERYELLKEALQEIEVTVYDSKGTLMAWADFRSCLPSNPTWQDEEDLCKRLYEECGFLIHPGGMCVADEPGYFRIVFTESAEGSLQELKERLKKFKK